uniref:HTH psq-type domain-containing protein n=1 Tax=Musca domestica TaxID=7370 RepID=A0A1I8MZX4_MUSDO
MDLTLRPVEEDLPKPAVLMPSVVSRGKRPPRNMTATDKVYAIQRVRNGETKASVSRSIGVPESTLRGWCKNEQKLRFMSRQQQQQTNFALKESSSTFYGMEYSIMSASDSNPEQQPAEKKFCGLESITNFNSPVGPSPLPFLNSASASSSCTDKAYAIQRVRNGESRALVSRSIGVSETTLRGWIKNDQKIRSMGGVDPPSACGMSGLGMKDSSNSEQFFNSENLNIFNNMMDPYAPTPSNSSSNFIDYFCEPALQPVNNPAIFWSPASILNTDYAELSQMQNLYLTALFSSMGSK